MLDTIFQSGEYQQPSLFCISDKGESFKTDHAALLSILRNDGVSATSLGSKPYNDLVSQFWFVVLILQTVFCRLPIFVLKISGF